MLVSAVCLAIEDVEFPNGGRRFEARIIDERDLIGFIEVGWEIVKSPSRSFFVHIVLSIYLVECLP